MWLKHMPWTAGDDLARRERDATVPANVRGALAAASPSEEAFAGLEPAINAGWMLSSSSRSDAAALNRRHPDELPGSEAELTCCYPGEGGAATGATGVVRSIIKHRMCIVLHA